MSQLAEAVAKLVAEALARLRLPAGQIDGQLDGRQVAPAAPGSPGTVSLSTATPQPLGTAAPGSSGAASDAGHIHAKPTPAQLGAEPALGNPATNGYVLSSTTAGVRSWAVQSGGMADPTTTAGDLIYRGPVSVTRLPIGAAGTFLRVAGGVPAWAALVSADISDLVETAQDLVAAMLVAGANLSFAYNDAAGTMTLSLTGALLTGNLSTATPAALGTAAAGSSANVSRADHVHAMLSASDLSAGTLADARLSSNVPLLNAANIFSASQTLSASPAGAIEQTIANTNAAGTTAAARSRAFVGAAWGGSVPRMESGVLGASHSAAPGGLAYFAGNSVPEFRLQAADGFVGFYSGLAEGMRLSGDSLLIGRTSGLTGAGDLDAAGRVRGATIETAAGSKWALAGYTAAADAASNGYVSVTINGVAYKLSTRA